MVLCKTIKSFAHCLLQTVVCFPHLGGVIELGVTDLVNFLRKKENHLLSFYLLIIKYYILLF